MSSLLIGKNGFLGGFLAESMHFGELNGSIDAPEQAAYDLVVVAAPSAKKYLANADPNADLEKCGHLIEKLSSIRAKKLVLLSTVDVYRQPNQSSEGSKLGGSSPYGDNRLLIDRFVRRHFSSYVILRLGGLVGPGLKKNPVYDLAHGMNLELISPRSQMQFLPISEIPRAIEFFLPFRKRTVNLTAEPIYLESLHSLTDKRFTGSQVQIYDVSSRYLELELGNKYWCSASTSINHINQFLKGDLD